MVVEVEVGREGPAPPCEGGDPPCESDLFVRVIVGETLEGCWGGFERRGNLVEKLDCAKPRRIEGAITPWSKQTN